TEEIGMTILVAKTSQEAWTSLATLFLTQTASQEDFLDQRWCDLKKGNQSMVKFIRMVKDLALRYAQVGKPNCQIYTGLSPYWEPIVLAQLERMLTMSTNELQSLLVSHEERRLYDQGTQSNASASAPLSCLLGVGPAKVLYKDGRKSGNGGKKNLGKNNGGKGNDGKGGRGSGDSTDRGQGGGGSGNPNFNFRGGRFRQRGYGQGGVGQSHPSQSNQYRPSQI
ncbi:hypothetical protein CRG98_046321, partial [Punica granatum]